jgi:hypothetical protein
VETTSNEERTMINMQELAKAMLQRKVPDWALIGPATEKSTTKAKAETVCVNCGHRPCECNKFAEEEPSDVQKKTQRA